VAVHQESVGQQGARRASSTSDYKDPWRGVMTFPEARG